MHNEGILMGRRIRRAVLIALSFVFLPQLEAQYVERVDVAVASIDVVVRDRDGKLVQGLTADDFEVYEDGKLQPITNFSAFDARAAAVTLATPAPAVEAPSPAVLPRPAHLFILF